MGNIYLAATKTSPEIDIKFDAHKMSFKGESFPEDVNTFYGPILKAIEEYLAATKGATINIEMQLIYFNSSSTKIYFNLFKLFEEASEFNTINVKWYYDKDDDSALEFGEEFKEDLEHVNFELIVHD